MLKRIDWLHAVSLRDFLARCIYVLEEGPRHQWFEDQTVETVAWASFVAALVFFERSFFSPKPGSEADAVSQADLPLACLLNLVIGFGIFRVGLFDSDLSRTRARLFQPRDRNHGVS